jgi:putative spermidine/putrescine transport system permease protein
VSSSATAGASLRRLTVTLGTTVGLLPFTFYVLLFLALPTGIALLAGFQDADGRWTTDNLAVLADPVIWRAIVNSLWLALVTSVVGALLGALVCYALLGLRFDGLVLRWVNAACSVLAQFGGVMLAFAFIATIGISGTVTTLLDQRLGVKLYSDGVWLYELPGLVLPYLYFQVPLMVIVFYPAMQVLRPQWAEANLALGGTRWMFWRRIGIPLLFPSFLGALLLLFANGFSAYSTAAALISQASPIVPLQIRLALSSETVLGRSNVAGVLALAMMAVMAVTMAVYALIQRRVRAWEL